MVPPVMSILLLVAIGAKLICPHGGLQVDKCHNSLHGITLKWLNLFFNSDMIYYRINIHGTLLILVDYLSCHPVVIICRMSVCVACQKRHKAGIIISRLLFLNVFIIFYKNISFWIAHNY